MQLQNAIKKLRKNGFEVTKVGDGDFNRKFVAKQKDNRDFIEICSQGGENGTVIIIDLEREGQEDDVMSDYHAGTYCDNLAQAIRLTTKQ